MTTLRFKRYVVPKSVKLLVYIVRVEILERGYLYKVWAEILYGDLELAIVEFDIRL